MWYLQCLAEILILLDMQRSLNVIHNEEKNQSIQTQK